jgi:hypothetical protein
MNLLPPPLRTAMFSTRRDDSVPGKRQLVEIGTTTWDPHWLGAANLAGTFIRVQQLPMCKAVSPQFASYFCGYFQLCCPMPKVRTLESFSRTSSARQQGKQHHDPEHSPNDEGRQVAAVLVFCSCIRLIDANHVRPPRDLILARKQSTKKAIRMSLIPHTIPGCPK